MMRGTLGALGAAAVAATALLAALSSIEASSRQELARHVGLYDFDAANSVYVGQIEEIPELLSLELATSRIRALHERSPTIFFTGPTAGAVEPVESEIIFTADGLLWREAGIVRTAKRAAFRTEDVRFRSNGAELAGTITFPSGRPPFPAVVLAHGSGAQDRNFVFIPALFARRGVAVLAFDKRGVGQSTGDWRSATLRDLAEDVLAGVRLLHARSDTRKDRIGVYGSSQGGWVAPIAASVAPDKVAFVIARSASGLPNRENIIYEIEGDLRANGFGDREVAAMQAIHRQEIAVVKANGRGWNEFRAALHAAASEPWFKYARLPETIIEDNDANRARVRDWILREQRDWLDPADVWPLVRGSVLVQNGLVDRYVPTQRSLEIIAAGLARGGNRNVTLKAYPRGDHGLFESTTGFASDIPKSRGLVPGYLQDLQTWIDLNVAK